MRLGGASSRAICTKISRPMKNKGRLTCRRKKVDMPLPSNTFVGEVLGVFHSRQEWEKWVEN